MAKSQTVWIEFNGQQYQVFVGANGGFYLYDPENQIDAQHHALPTLPRVTKQDGRLGMSQEGAVAGTLVPAALSFVPVVGPVLGPLASALVPIVSNMFGGNDPTPAGDLQQAVIDYRQGIVNANKQLGIPDQMPMLPPGKSYRHPYANLPILLELWPENASIDDNNHWTCDWSGVKCDGCGAMRKCFYAAINKLKPILDGKMQQLQQKTQQATLDASIQRAVAAVAPAALPSQAYAPPVLPQQIVYKPTQSLFPGGGGAINWGTPASDADLQPYQAPAAPVAAAGMPVWALPLLLLGIPLTMGLVMGPGTPPQKVPVRKARRAA